MNQTPAWAIGLTTSVEIDVRQMASILRFFDPHSSEYISAMQRLARMVAAEQQHKDSCQQTQQSHEDASHSTGGASGAASVDTSSGSIKSSAPAGPTTGSASAKTTTTASAAVASASTSASTASRSYATRADALAKTATEKAVSSPPANTYAALSRRIVKTLINDLQDRRGLKQQWDCIESSIQKEVISDWIEIVRKELKK